MSGWEIVSAFPDDQSGDQGAFRSQGESVLALRDDRKPSEAVTHLLASHPERPFSESPTRVAVTSVHVYVDRHDGQIARIARSRLYDARQESGGIWHYLFYDESTGATVTGKVELLLPSRHGCPVQALLSQQLEAEAHSDLMQSIPSMRVVAMAITGIFFVVACWLFLEYPPGGARGLSLTSERMMGTMAAFACAVAASLTMLLVPSEVIVHRRRLERKRGWPLTFLSAKLPWTEVEALVVRRSYARQNNVRYLVGYRIEFRLKEPRRLATFGKVPRLDYAFLRWGRTMRLEEAPKHEVAIRALRDRAVSMANELGEVIGVPVKLVDR